MDDKRFDRLTMALAGDASRRRLLKVLAAVAGGIATARIGRNSALASHQPGPVATCNAAVLGNVRCLQEARAIYGAGNPCLLGAACNGPIVNSSTGLRECTFRFAAAGTTCDDGNACTAGDACDGAGHCTGGPRISCDDGDACTLDSCDPATGCVHTPVVCEAPDACHSGGVCDPATGCLFERVDCSGLDGQCTAGVCNGETGACETWPANVGNPCDSGDACFHGSTCDDTGQCRGGQPVSCDDGDACTIDTCDAREGCLHTPVVCEAPDACHVGGRCDPVSGCMFDVIDCSHLDGQCTAGVCNPTTGACEAWPANLGKPCNDGNVCTEEPACQPDGTCGGGRAVTCPTPDVCHEPAVCDPASGCPEAVQAVAACKSGRIKDEPCDCDGACCTPGDNCVGKPGQRRCKPKHKDT